MPKFREQEKDRIRECLCEKAEKLFLARGLRKVTIDELADAAGIAKPTFYRFYSSKEELFLDIAKRRQLAVFQELHAVLGESLPDREKVRKAFERMASLLVKYPLLTGIDEEVAEMIRRKVSAEKLEEFRNQGAEAVKELFSRGIRFRYGPEVITALFETLYASWMHTKYMPQDRQKQVTDILLEGILDEILESPAEEGEGKIV